MWLAKESTLQLISIPLNFGVFVQSTSVIFIKIFQSSYNDKYKVLVSICGHVCTKLFVRLALNNIKVDGIEFGEFRGRDYQLIKH